MMPELQTTPLFYCLIRWEHLVFHDGMPDHAVQRLDGIRCVNDFADICRVSEKRRQVSPV